MFKRLVLNSLLVLAVSLFMVSGVYAKDYIIKIKDNVVMPYSLDEKTEAISAKHNLFVSDEETAKELYKSGLAEYIEEDVKVEAFSYNDTYYSSQTYFQNAEIEQLQEKYGYGDGVRVAVIDSGVNLNHTDLQGTNIETGYNFVDNNTDVTDEINHGTGVLGVMGAVTNNGKGVSGIAPNATYVPLKFLDSSGAGSLSDMISAMYAAVDTYNCKIINMSVGVILETEMEVLNSAVNYVTKKGAIIVCACGNYGTNVYCYPASCKNTISVGSATSGYALQSYSQRNDKVDVVTQSGFYVLSKTGGYKSGSGTSFSSPIIAGVAAILASKYPNMTYTDFENVIKAATMDILDSGKDYAGYGFFKALSAVDFLESDSEVFVSPIYKNGTTMNLKMFTSKDFSTGKAVLSYFKDNRFTTSEITDITASDGVYFKSVSVDENSDELHIFAIKDILNLRGISDTNILKY